MKIAIFGGSFNPVHLGHVKMVQYLCENFDFDKILVIPAGIPSHKNRYSISGEDRYNMCKLAFENFEKVQVNSVEIDSKKTCYTIDTLMELKNIYKDGIFYEVIGEDSANSFDTWKNFEKILRESQIIVFKRDRDENTSNSNFKNRFTILQAPYFKYSSTKIREYLQKTDERDNFKKLKKMLPEKVLKYILENNLYGINMEDIDEV